MKTITGYIVILSCCLAIVTSLNCKKNETTLVAEDPIVAPVVVSPNVPTLDDFFPLFVGKKFTFTTRESFYAGSMHGGYTSGHSLGRVYWKVVSKQDTMTGDGLFQYKYRLAQSYFDSASGVLSSLDDFVVLENKNTSQLSIGNNYLTRTLAFPADLRRFYTKDSISTISFGNWVEGVIMKKDSGIVSYGYHSNGITLGIDIDRQLVGIQ